MNQTTSANEQQPTVKVQCTLCQSIFDSLPLFEAHAMYTEKAADAIKRYKVLGGYKKDLPKESRIEKAAKLVPTIRLGDPVMHIYTVNFHHTVNWSKKTCTCPDFQFRTGPKGLMCKHLLAVEMLESGVEVPTS